MSGGRQYGWEQGVKIFPKEGRFGAVFFFGRFAVAAGTMGQGCVFLFIDV